MIELLDAALIVPIGLPKSGKSDFLRELSESGIIDARDSIVLTEPDILLPETSALVIGAAKLKGRIGLECELRTASGVRSFDTFLAGLGVSIAIVLMSTSLELSHSRIGEEISFGDLHLLQGEIEDMKALTEFGSPFWSQSVSRALDGQDEW